MNMIRVMAIDENSEKLKQVIDLGYKYKGILGFLPEGAFIEYANRKQIIAAFDEKSHTIGYLLYRINYTNNFVYIVHLCVEKLMQRRGVAKKLFEYFKKGVCGKYFGIKVKCRRDYEANKLWPYLGFFARDEIEGRSKHGSILTIWWYDFGLPNLFSLAAKQSLLSKIRVSIDANVFYQLLEPVSKQNEETHAMVFSDWLDERITFCITSEIFNEIDRNKDSGERKSARQFAESFVIIPAKIDDHFHSIWSQLQDIFSKKMKQNDISDLRHLTISIMEDLTYFITLDDLLLKKSEELYNKFKIRILRPSHFIIDQDSVLHDAEYQPVRLAETQIKKAQLRLNDLESIDIFRTNSETKSDFNNKLSVYLSDPQRFKTIAIKANDNFCALVVYDRAESNQLLIPVFRVSKGNLSIVVGRHLIVDVIMTCLLENRPLAKMSEKFLSDSIVDALLINGFTEIDSQWIKLNGRMILGFEDLKIQISLWRDLYKTVDKYWERIANLITELDHQPNTSIFLELEKILFPSKMLDLDIPAYLVPIKPQWAINLFDTMLGGQELFGGSPELVMSIENAYYSARKLSFMKPPARILWYVSDDKLKRYSRIKSIRACSYLNELVIDNPKKLFSRFNRLGTFNWDDVFDIAKRRSDHEITGFRFSHTELFKKPIALKTVQSIWKEIIGKNLNIQSPISIGNDLFFKLYKIGNQMD